MRFKFFLASPSNAKTRFVAALIAILVTYMTSGEAFPDGADRLLGVAHLPTSNERNLRTSAILTSDDEERLPLESVAKNVKDFLLLKKNPFAGDRVNEPLLRQIVLDHAPSSSSSKMAKVNVLAALRSNSRLSEEVEASVLATLRRLGGDARLADFLRTYVTKSRWKDFCSSMSDRLFSQWLDEGVTTRKAFARLRLNRIKVEEVFNEPLLVTWWIYAEKIKLQKSNSEGITHQKDTTTIDPEKIEHEHTMTMLSEMSNTLSHYYKFVPTITTLSRTSQVASNSLPKHLYRFQLQKWKELDLQPSQLAEKLDLTKQNWYSDVRRLFVWVDYVVMTNRGKLLQISIDTFGDKTTKMFLTLNRQGTMNQQNVVDEAQLDGIARMKNIFANDGLIEPQSVELQKRPQYNV